MIDILLGTGSVTVLHLLGGLGHPGCYVLEYPTPIMGLVLLFHTGLHNSGRFIGRSYKNAWARDNGEVGSFRGTLDLVRDVSNIAWGITEITSPLLTDTTGKTAMLEGPVCYPDPSTGPSLVTRRVLGRNVAAVLAAIWSS